MKNKTLQTWAVDTAFTAVGCFISALGISSFLAPLKLSSGGISSLATVFLHLFHIPLSVTNLVFNIALFIFAYRFLGKGTVVKTLLGIGLFSLSLQITSSLIPIYPEEDLFMATIVGGVLVGVGIGLVVRRDGSTGGSDLAALILHRIFPHIPVATFVLVIDCSIIVLAGFLFQSISITLYSMVSLYVSSKLIDMIITMGDAAKSVYIISPKSQEIADGIMKEFVRGVTGIQSKGMYSDTDTLMLLCAVSPKEMPALMRMVHSYDENAFVIISDAREVVGEGFKDLSAV